MSEKIEEVMNEFNLGDEEDFDIPDEVNVSALNIITSISKIVKIAKTAGAGEGAEATAELEEYFQSDSGKQTMYTVVALAATVMNVFDFEDMGEMNFMSLILDILITMVGLFAVFFLMMFMPIIMIIKTIIILIQALANMKEPERVSGSVANKLAPMVTLPLTIMLFQCVVPGMTYASGVVMIAILAIASIVLGFLVSRTRAYEKGQFAYINIVQGCALVAIAGFLVFFFNLINTGIFKAFVDGNFASYMTEVMLAMTNNPEAVVNKKFIVDGIMMLVYLVLVLVCTAYVGKAAKRLSCTGGKKLKDGSYAKVKDNNLVNVIFMLPIFIIPKVVMGMMHYYKDISSTAAQGDGSFLVLAAEQQSALTGVLVGLIIMFVAEVAVLVLKGVFCKEISADAMEQVMAGEAEAAEFAESVEEDLPVEDDVAAAEEPVDEALVEEAAENTEA